jgi:hypothetical protein
VNDKPVDRFTLLHFLGGVALGRAGLRTRHALALGVGWEFVERPLKKKWPHLFPHPSQDSIDNAVVDSAMVGVGAMIGRRMKR